MTVIEEIAAERKRQIEVEGWTEAHDNEHAEGELGRGGACYALLAFNPNRFHMGYLPGWWPFQTDWWKPKDPRRNLVRAAALIVAEIERLDRAPATPTITKGAGNERR